MKLVNPLLLPSHIIGNWCYLLVKKYDNGWYEHKVSWQIDTDYTIAVWHVRAK